MKEKHKGNRRLNTAQNSEQYENSDTGYGLESVTKGNDFAEGDSRFSSEYSK